MKKLSIFFLCAAGCAAAPEPPPGLDLSTATLIDLSYTYDDETLYWPTSPTDFILEELDYGTSEDGYFYAAYSFGCRSYIYNGVNNLQAHYRWYVTDCF